MHVILEVLLTYVNKREKKSKREERKMTGQSDLPKVAQQMSGTERKKKQVS